MRALQVFALGLVLFFAGLAIHESLHLLVVYAVGGQGHVIFRPWRFTLLPITLPSVHVQPSQPLGLGRQAADNFLGPALAALIFGVLAWRVPLSPIRLALAANAAILVFFALIETGYLLLYAVADVEAPVLVAPEFNYGVPLAILVLAAISAGVRPPQVPQLRSA